ncbi:peptidoglycan editing factor PgeF [Legionella yabuuchiae]|uniref:peptidoglycan editing factor PgeF n=1 Tax=Legionella yabuuchiae TaxID=376727 RepID=UPI001056667E|nr:peptidoglycan editing factor PgeF [Legionella yabuuchiae]
MNYIIPEWPAPNHIGALTTTRLGGESNAPFDSNNLALHVGDNPEHVRANRKALVQELNLPSEPEWLDQNHTNHCVVAEDVSERKADAAITHDSKRILAVMTADCLPILLCDRKGTEIAAIHAGWKGLADGIIENTLKKMNNQPAALIAWIGPSICKSCYEVGEDVMAAFAKSYPNMRTGFHQQEARWYADLPLLAKLIMSEQGLEAVYASGICTKEDEKHFYSYRRDGQTGRMATLIWFKQDK